MSESPAASMHSAPVRRHYRYVWLAGLTLYAGVLWLVGWQGIRDAAAGTETVFLLGVVGMEAASELLRAVKWRYALGRRSRAVGLFYLSKGAGHWSPARVGELAPLLLSAHRSPRIGAWIVVDRLLESAATLGLGLFGLAAMDLSVPGMAAGLIGAVIVLVAAPAYALTRREWFERLAGRMPLGTVWARGVKFLALTSQEAGQFKGKLPALASLSVAATCLDLCAAIFLFRAFGYSVGFTLLAVVQCAHTLTSVIPLTPNATGVPYLAAGALIHRYAAVPVATLAVALPLQAALTGAVFWSVFAVACAGLRKRPQVGESRSQARLFDGLARGGVLYEYAPDALEKLNALYTPKGRLLDVGCGDGVIGAALDADEVVGCDISFRCAALSREKGLRVAVADAKGALPFADGAFDTIYCVDVLHHLGQAWDAIFPELDRVLRSGGALVIVEPDARNLLVRWTQAPGSPIRVAPHDDEPAIDPAELTPHLARLGYEFTCGTIRIEGRQVERRTRPLWKRLAAAPFVLALAALYGRRPDKFTIIAKKPL